MSEQVKLYSEHVGKVVEGHAWANYLPATHDELIAAMPRCMTCKERDTCTTLAVAGKDDWKFGCINHKERST